MTESNIEHNPWGALEKGVLKILSGRVWNVPGSIRKCLGFDEVPILQIVDGKPHMSEVSKTRPTFCCLSFRDLIK